MFRSLCACSRRLLNYFILIRILIVITLEVVLLHVKHCFRLTETSCFSFPSICIHFNVTNIKSYRRTISISSPHFYRHTIIHPSYSDPTGERENVLLILDELCHHLLNLPPRWANIGMIGNIELFISLLLYYLIKIDCCGRRTRVGLSTWMDDGRHTKK